MDLSAGRTWGQVVSVTSDGFARCKKPLGQKIMKYTTVKISEIAKHPTKRMDAQYWLARVNNLKLKKIKKRKKLQASSSKLQA